MGGAFSSLCLSAKSVATMAVPDFGLGSHDDEDGPDVRDDDRSASNARDMVRRFSALVSPVTVERLAEHNINFARADRLSEQRSLPRGFRRTTSFTPPIQGELFLHSAMRAHRSSSRMRAPCFLRMGCRGSTPVNGTTTSLHGPYCAWHAKAARMRHAGAADTVDDIWTPGRKELV